MRTLVLGSILASLLTAAPSADTRLADSAMRPDRNAVLKLIEQHADPNTPQLDGTTALHWAAHWNDTELAKKLIEAGASPKIANRYGVTPLSEAALNANVEMTQLLLKAGADPNAAQAEGETVLMTASRTGNVDVVRLLIEAGAKVDARESWRWQTPLMWAAAENHADVVKLLLERGADVNATSAVFDFTTLRPKAGSIPMNFPRGGFSALLFAARQGAFDAAKTLVERGADVNIADPDNTSPLLIAVINFHYDLAAYLIEKGADVNKADKMGRAPLYAAIDMRNLDVSTRPSPRTDDKRTALDIIRLLLDKGADTNAKLAKVIPARGVLDGADGTLGIGATPFLRAARSQDLQVMKMLLDKGADWKLATADNATAMHLCAGLAWRDGKTRGSETGSIECLQMLLDKGADIQAQTVRTGEMPLHGAAARGADKIVQFLVDKGANPTAKDKTGRTPLDVAMGVGANVAGVRAPQESTVALLKQLIAKASPQASSEQPKP